MLWSDLLHYFFVNLHGCCGREPLLLAFTRSGACQLFSKLLNRAEAELTCFKQCWTGMWTTAVHGEPAWFKACQDLRWSRATWHVHVDLPSKSFFTFKFGETYQVTLSHHSGGVGFYDLLRTRTLINETSRAFSRSLYICSSMKQSFLNRNEVACGIVDMLEVSNSCT